VFITLDDDFTGVILCLDRRIMHRRGLLRCLGEAPLGDMRVCPFNPDNTAELPLSQIVSLLYGLVTKLLAAGLRLGFREIASGTYKNYRTSSRDHADPFISSGADTHYWQYRLDHTIPFLAADPVYLGWSNNIGCHIQSPMVATSCLSRQSLERNADGQKESFEET
jgi:hypothetical protein